LKKLEFKITASKKSDDIIKLYEFSGNLLKNIICEDPIFKRKLTIVNSNEPNKKSHNKRGVVFDNINIMDIRGLINNPSLYGSGFNLLSPGHDIYAEKICMDNGIYEYQGYLNDKFEIEGLEIFFPKKIDDNYMLKTFNKNKILLAKSNHLKTHLIHIENQEEVFERTISQLKIIIDENMKRDLLKELRGCNFVPNLTIFNNEIKKGKNSFNIKVPSSYKTVFDVLDNITYIPISNEDTININKNFLIPIFKNSNGEIEIDENINRFIDDNKKIDNKQNCYFSSDFIEFVLNLKSKNDQTKFYIAENENFLKDKAQIQIENVIDSILIQNSENTDINDISVNSAIDNIFSKNYFISKLNLKKMMLGKNSKVSPNNVKFDCFILAKKDHESKLVNNIALQYLNNKEFPYACVKTVGDIFNKEGKMSQINYEDIINGTEIFNYFKLQSFYFKGQENLLKEYKFGYGADSLRLILAMNDLDKDMIILEEDLTKSKSDIRMIRRMARHFSLLNNLYRINLKENSVNSTVKMGENRNKSNEICFKNLNILDKWLCFKYVLLLNKIEDLTSKGEEKILFNEYLRLCLDFIQNYFNNYILSSLRRLEESSDKKEYIDIINIVFFNINSIFKNILAMLAPFIPFNTQFIFSNIFKSDGLLIKDLKITSLTEFKNSLNLSNEELNLLSFKLKYLEEIQTSIRKITIANAKFNKIPLKDLTVAIESKGDKIEELILLTNQNELKYFLNVKKVIITKENITTNEISEGYSKIDIKNLKKVFEKQIQVIIPEIHFSNNKIIENKDKKVIHNIKCILLINKDYKREHMEKEDYWEDNYIFNEPYNTRNNNLVDTFKIEIKNEGDENPDILNSSENDNSNNIDNITNNKKNNGIDNKENNKNNEFSKIVSKEKKKKESNKHNPNSVLIKLSEDKNKEFQNHLEDIKKKEDLMNTPKPFKHRIVRNSDVIKGENSSILDFSKRFVKPKKKLDH
jgi:hypothetical protein